jgi:hypothetical protein
MNITHFKKIYIKKVDDYLEECQDHDYEYQKTYGDKSNSYEEKTKVKLPTIEGFAAYIGITRKTLYNWAKENGKFADALEKIKNEQLARLINRGLEGTYNNTITKLILSHNHGMKERIDNTTDDEPITSSFSDDQIDRIADRIASRKGSNGDTPSA